MPPACPRAAISALAPARKGVRRAAKRTLYAFQCATEHEF
jgi:hypothetical protein